MAAPLIKTLLGQSFAFSLAKQSSILVGARHFSTKNSDLNHELSLPPKPKRPASSWITFVKERKDDILSQKEKMKVDELATILSKEWRNMDRSQYENDYKKKLNDYAQSMEDYHNSLTAEQKAQLKYQSYLNRETKALKELKKTKPPKMPRNAANFYCIEKYQDTEVRMRFKNEKSAKVFSDLFKEYRLLSESEKQKYFKMHQDDINRFKEEFLQWYDKIMADENLSKTAIQQAESMKNRFQTLNYL